MFGPNNVKTLLKLKSLVKQYEEQEENEETAEQQQDNENQPEIENQPQEVEGLDEEEKINTENVHYKSVCKTMSNFYKPLLNDEESKIDSPKGNSETNSDEEIDPDKDYYGKFYNLLYEDDNFKEFKERLELDCEQFESDFKKEFNTKSEQTGLSIQITKCLKEIQEWKEDRKKIQKELEEKERIEREKELSEINRIQTEKQKEQDKIIKLEEERIKQHHNDVVHNGINKIEQAISKVKCNENKMKSEAKKEVIDQTLKSKKYDQLESINNDTLSFEVFKLQEYNDKYENEHDEEPIIVDDKYLKIMEDIYKMQDELDDLYNVYSVPELSNPQES